MLTGRFLAQVLTFEFQGLHVLHPSKEALASLWLHELVDHEEREISLPVYKSQNLKQLKQNVRLTSSPASGARKPHGRDD